MDDFLTQEQIEKLTKPLTQPAAQSRHLTALGIEHARARDGSIAVTWTQVNNPRVVHQAEEQPNWPKAMRR